ncbi:fatty acid desaturase [Streptomyces lavendofoliae]|uniref:Fatty acid desaturase n=1 Tax=Streptomyces lavendofoliae TaxID=67314 RepID=A0A918I4N4_9ACTN|nr:fatty acid desaturase [Streptomyces lavendofoliae]GGU63392.1 fatty acid desaturase [Streptomyces lavendofoliae]
MTSDASTGNAPGQREPWRDIVARYRTTHTLKSLAQVANTFPLYFALLYLMCLVLSHSYWWTLALSPMAAALLVRIAVILHDCGHGSFFRSRRANDALGTFCGFLAFVPYHQWRKAHALHHATSGDLDRRGVGDVPTLTVREYLGRSRWGRLRYRMFRSPAFYLGAGPTLLLLVGQRLVNPSSGSTERRSVHCTNAVFAGVIALTWWTGTLTAFLLVYGPVLLLSSTALVYLFYVQHQFENTYWERRERWDYFTAAVRGSSFLQLPSLLRWCTANLGYHHVHHLSSRIPNYALRRCHDENPIFHQATVITLRSSLRSLRLRLWDEDQQRLVDVSAAGPAMRAAPHGSSPLKAGVDGLP